MSRWRFAAILAASLVAPSARADNVADAEELFRRAKALTTANKFTEACPLFKESYRLDPAQGTLLNLALCNEQIGKIGTAWGQFRAVEQQARRATPPRMDRVEVAKAHADKLEPRLSRIKLVVSPAVRVPGLAVKVDGEDKGEPLWSAGIVVDPGSHTIEESAPKKKPTSFSVSVDREATTQNVELKALEDAPEPKKPPVVVDTTDYGQARAQKTQGLVVGAAGLAVLAAGGVFGVLAIVNDKDAKKCDPCVVGSNEATASNSSTDRALLFSNVANVAIPIGVVAAAIGGYLVLTAGPTEKVAVVPSLSPNAASVEVRWRAW